MGTVVGYGGNPMSGLWQMTLDKSLDHYGLADALDFPSIVHFGSGSGARALARAFDGELDNIIGQTIVFSVDEFGVLDGFTPVGEWELALPGDEGWPDDE